VTSPTYGVELVHSVTELAKVAQGELFGDGSVSVFGVAELARAKVGDITYAVNDRYIKQLAVSSVSAAVVPRGAHTKLNVSIPLIEVDNPYWSFAQILAEFAPEIPTRETRVHNSAIIAENVKLASSATVGPHTVIEGNVCIGENATIGAGCYLGYGASIGENCLLHPNVVIREFCTVGANVIINSGTVIGSDGYGFAERDGEYHKIPQIGIVEIEDDVEIGSLVCVDRATIGKTIIGRGSKLDNLIQIGHNCEIGAHCAIVSQVGLSGSTIVGEHCRFAGQSATSGHLTIGAHSTVAARGVVVRDLAEGSFVSGFPARPHAEERKISAALPRLPDLLKRLRSLEKRLESFDSGDTHQ